jgi:TPR repeat protein
MSLPRIFVLASILLGISLGPVSATSPFDTSVVQIAVNHTDSAITEKTIKRIYSSGTPREQLDFFKRLLRGTGVEADPKRAMGFLRRAAERGFAPAQHQMALYHIKGTKFVAKNVADAVKWYRKAAQQDYAVSQRILGRLLEQGRLVKKDYTEAGKWYLKAAAQGDRRAASLPWRVV